VSNSPAEYVAELRAQNKILRANVVQLCREKQVLEDVIARQSAYILELKRQTGRTPHDYEPARPGLSDVD
jgi:hypothetical protein